MNKKGATSISIVLLVLVVLVLVGFTLFSFHSKKAEAESFICQSFEDVYAGEEKINFCLSQKKSIDVNFDYGGVLNECVGLVENARLIDYDVEIIEDYGDMKVTYIFKPKV